MGLSSLALLLAVWFSSATIGTLANKEVMAQFPYPIVFTFFHLLVGIIMDLASLRRRALSVDARWSVLVRCIPAALCLAFGKVATYVSYGKVSVALVHTVKASSPIYAVVVSKMFLSESIPTCSLYALIPIAVGVAMSSINELSSLHSASFFGFLSAMSAALIGVLQNVFTKLQLKSTQLDPLIIHLYTSLTAIVFLIPVALCTDVVTMWNVHNSPSPTPFVPIGAICISLFFTYLQNIGSLLVLSKVDQITHQVANCLKRLIVIICSVFYFRTVMTTSNAFGICLAVFGFFNYSRSQSKSLGAGLLPFRRLSDVEMLESHNSRDSTVYLESSPDALTRLSFTQQSSSVMSPKVQLHTASPRVVALPASTHRSDERAPLITKSPSNHGIALRGSGSFFTEARN